MNQCPKHKVAYSDGLMCYTCLEEELAAAKAENARLAAALQDSIAREWPSKPALRELLSPVGSLLIDQKRLMEYAGRKLEVERIDKQLARLRAAMG